MSRALLLLLLATPVALAAQRDSARTTALDTVLVTAERTRSTLGSSTAAVTRIEAADLARIPHASVADVLRLVPGFAVVSFDGLGAVPQLMVRGFYGGGEAEYVVVLVDGKPVNQLHTGLVAWDALPPIGSIEAVEVVRGSASPLYGDAALGAVVNVITRPARGPASPRWSIAGGTYGTWRASGDLAGTLGDRAVALSAGIDRSDGFRDHAERTTGRAHARVALAEGIALSAMAHRRDYDEPGALLESLLEENRKQSDSLFQFDHTEDSFYALTLSGTRRRVSASLSGEYRDIDAIRTIALAPGFGDTKERVATNGRIASSVLLHFDALTLGVDVSHGTLDSKYFEVAAGERGASAAEGDGSRSNAAIFAQYVLQPTGALRLSLGGRVDWLSDAFEGEDASHTAFSPKLGVNVRLHATTHAYATASRSFKAPTLDQLFDQRSIPVPFPPFSLTTSNRNLNPQYGTNVEGGLYHSRGRLTGSVSLYHMDLKDELDFDVQTLRYMNIGRSRHRGLEVGARYEPRPANAIFATYTLQRATARSGDNAGKQLKAIPRHSRSGGFTIVPHARVSVSVVFTHAARMFLDDANTRDIAEYSRFDGQLSYALTRSLRLTLEASNLANYPHNSTGFPDPAGGPDAYFYPAAGRALQLGVRRGW